MNGREEALNDMRICHTPNGIEIVFDGDEGKHLSTILQALTQPEPEVVSVEEVCDLKEFDNQNFLSVIKIINKHYPNKDIIIRSSEK